MKDLRQAYLAVEKAIGHVSYSGGRHVELLSDLIVIAKQIHEVAFPEDYDALPTQKIEALEVDLGRESEDKFAAAHARREASDKAANDAKMKMALDAEARAARRRELHEELQDIAMSPAADKYERFEKVLAEKRALRDTVPTTRRRHSDPCLEAWVNDAKNGN